MAASYGLSHAKRRPSHALSLWRRLIGHGKRKNLYHCALRIDLVRPHWQVAIILAACLVLCVSTRGRLSGTCIVVCHPGRRVLCYTAMCLVCVEHGRLYCVSMSSIVGSSDCTFVRLRMLGEKKYLVPRTGEAQSTVVIIQCSSTMYH